MGTSYPFHALVFLQFGSRLIPPKCLLLLLKPRDTLPASDGHVVDVHDVKENCLQTNNCHQIPKTLGLVNYDQIYPAKTYNCQSESQQKKGERSQQPSKNVDVTFKKVISTKATLKNKSWYLIKS